jgi:Protein of unknown function (DUF4242)
VKTYLVLRRSGWRSAQVVDEATERSRSVAEEGIGDDVRVIRSYVIDEGRGSLGMVCICQATSRAALRRHASRAILPADEIVLVADTVVVRPDPVPTESSPTDGRSDD